VGWHLIVICWPAIVVWLCITMPMCAFSGHKILARQRWPGTDDPIMPEPFRAFIWVTCHTWPYTKLYRLGRTLDEYDMATSCPACGRHRTSLWPLDDQIDHALTHFLVDERRAWDTWWWTPPAGMSIEDAQAWLDARSDRPPPEL
jgi:hypothetical protein